MKNLFRAFGIILLCAVVFASTIPGTAVFAGNEISVPDTEDDTAVEPAADPDEIPAAEPAADPDEIPAAEPAADPDEVPADEPAADPDEIPADEPAADPDEIPADEPAADPDDLLFPKEISDPSETDPFFVQPEEVTDDPLFDEDLPLEIAEPEEMESIEPAYASIQIDSYHFPNENLRQLIANQFDNSPKDGRLNTDEISAAKSLNASYSSTHLVIADISGLSYLWNLEELNLFGQDKLTISYSTDDLPRGSLKKLTITNCSLLTEVDASVFTVLETLVCGCSTLEKIKCGSTLKNLTIDITSPSFTLENISACTALTSLSLTDSGLKTLTINSSALKSLTCNNNDALTSVSLSQSKNIQTIDVKYNALNSLTLPSSAQKLTELSCSSNNLKTLTVPAAPVLGTLECNKNRLTSLTVGTNAAHLLDCSDNQLSSLNLGTFGNKLRYLNCQNNNLSSLKLTAFPNLLALRCSGNNLSSLNITENSSLINCYKTETPVEKDGVLSYGVSAQSVIRLVIDKAIQNKINCGVPIGHTYFPDETFRSIVADKAIDKDQTGFISYTEQGALKTLDVSGKGITNLDGIQVFNALRSLDCSNNQITWLNLTLLESLETLNCSANPLTSIIWSGDGHTGPKETLKALNCSDTSLGALAPSLFPALEDLDCSYIGLSSLNVSSNGSLITLNCAGNEGLTSLNVGNNTKLQTLNCSLSGLKSLNLSKNTALVSVECQYNSYLTSLTLPSGTKLKTLNCGFCMLSALDVSKNTALTYLSCPINELSKLDVSACPSLTEALLNGTRTESSSYGFYIYKTGTSSNAGTLILDPGVATVPDPTKLDAPVLTSIQNTTSGITIKWNSVKYAKAYRIYRKDDSSNEGWKKYKDVSGSSVSYTDKKVDSGIRYYYKMRCITEDRQHMASGYSNSKSILFLSKAAITSVNNHASGVELKWKKVNGAEKYRIYRKTGSGSYEQIKTTSTLKYTDRTAESGVTYSYQVQAACGSVTGYKSSVKEILFLSQPKITSVTAYKGKNIIRWDAVTGAATYRVFRKGPGDPSWIKIKSTGTLSYTDKEVVKGVEYTYSVRAVDSTGKYLSCYAAGSDPVKAK